MSNMSTTGKRAPRQVEARQREALALELRKGGANYAQIGDRLGVSERRAGHIVRRALDRVVREPAEELIELEASRLDALWMAAFPKAMKGSEKAMLVCLRIQERRARLLGLDQPVKIDADVTHRDAPTEVEVAKLRDDLEARRARRRSAS